MDSNASSYLLNHAAFSSYIGKEESNIIDLGLSLRIVQPNSACYSPSHGNDVFSIYFGVTFVSSDDQTSSKLLAPSVYLGFFKKINMKFKDCVILPSEYISV